MITANDLYYLPRVKNLEREALKCYQELIELTNEFNNYLHFEIFDIMVINVLNDRRQTVRDTIEALENQIERLKLETLN